MKKLLDLGNPFFKPLWIRVAVVAVCFGWTLFELSNGSTGWALIFGGLGAYCGWQFAIIDYSADPED